MFRNIAAASVEQFSSKMWSSFVPQRGLDGQILQKWCNDRDNALQRGADLYDVGVYDIIGLKIQQAEGTDASNSSSIVSHDINSIDVRALTGTCIKDVKIDLLFTFVFVFYLFFLTGFHQICQSYICFKRVLMDSFFSLVVHKLTPTHINSHQHTGNSIGRVRSGHQIIGVNGRSVENVSHAKISMMLALAMKDKRPRDTISLRMRDTHWRPRAPGARYGKSFVFQILLMLTTN